MDKPVSPGAVPRDCENSFLPDFCGTRMVFVVVVIAELLALVLALAPAPAAQDRWADIGLVSLFIQWVALSCTAVLCISRRWLCRLGNTLAALLGYGLMLLVTLALSEAGYWIMATVDPGNIINREMHDVFLLRNLAISAIISAVALRYFYVQHQMRRHLESQAEARIQALQARIRPHFLFNSMNTIAALIRTGPELAEAAVEDLSDLFRATLGDARTQVTVGDELTLVRRYLHIEGLRLGERLKVEWDVDTLPDSMAMPALLLQPLVENAIYHGIEPAASGGVIRIAGRLDGRTLRLSVSNPRPPAAARPRTGNQMAVDNIRERLELAYDGRAHLRVDETDADYTVSLSFPVEAPGSGSR
jgi:two-component system sensor histidine kinase AlgZ